MLKSRPPLLFARVGSRKGSVRTAGLVFIVALGALAALVAPSFAGVVSVKASASADPSFGVAEDAFQYASDHGATLLPKLKATGMGVIRLSALYDGSPVSISGRQSLDGAIDAASSAGVSVILALYPATPTVPDSDRFCGWVKNVASRYYAKGVDSYIIGNEVNATRFWSPQHTDADPNFGATSYEKTLASCYDSLKAVDASIRVIGMGLSPRAVDGNSTRPLDFIVQVGQAYRRSRRMLPIMDAIAVHPYPNPNADPPPAPGKAGYDNSGFYGIPQLDRVKDAVESAFSDTEQSTTRDGLDIVIDEIGYQTETKVSDIGYTGSENSPVVTESQQADYYSQIIRLYRCDPTISEVLFFHLVDEPNLASSSESGGWQSGLLHPDLTAKPSYDAVRASLIGGDASCSSRPRAKPPVAVAPSRSDALPAPQVSTSASAGVPDGKKTMSPSGTTLPKQKASSSDANAEDTTVLDISVNKKFDSDKKLLRVDIDLSGHPDNAETDVAVQVYGRTSSAYRPRWITLGRVVLDENGESAIKVRTKLNMKLIKDGAKMRLVDTSNSDIVSSGEIDQSQ